LIRRRQSGIAEDGKYQSLTEDPRPAMFLPILQSPSSETALVVRSNRDPQQLTAAMQNAMRNLDSGLPVLIETWNQKLDLALFPSRVATISLGVLGAMGAMLSNNRYLRYGCVFGEQAEAGVGDSHGPRRAA
jgi:hypothetical protein